MSTKSGKMLRVTLLKSPFGKGKDQMATVRGLGLRRLRHTVLVEDTPSVRGMINKVGHMLKCEGETDK
ncbi:MAG: 50S ribosomal protein L30 [Candidatus Muproteobacteria bacterium RBG_16_62_13]|uniref:Large ribosomal subunit protein uL30 n=1 Tax=Candidatus Muproteobacteria bacterium RBG_16_62_13 TaxID=1817756 RepID=A0A1F6T7R8_9PROT|nr:MAG: 50S ribosomal protein L30 [Candidatus Muproteobacteria bacterium RBG_16_62_13]